MSRALRSLLPLIILLAHSSLCLRAQGLVLTAVDTTGWPNLSAHVYVVDAAGAIRTGLRGDDLRVLDNGRQATGVTVECGPAPSPEALSSVLVMDVSGSMSRPGQNATVANIELARAAAGAWIDAMPEGSEVALTSFDDNALVVRDLTENRASAREAIPLLRPSGGTSYEDALFNPTDGAFNVARPAQHKRVVVFLTDGLGSLNVDDAVRQAQDQDVTIYCVTLGLRAPGVLRQLTERTGGECFENVTSMAEARAVYGAILQSALGGKPCTLRWRAIPDCNRAHTVSITESGGGTATTAYTISDVRSSRLTVNPPLARLAPGEREAKITLRAEGGDIQVNTIAPSGSIDRGLSLDGGAPFTLRAGQERTLTVRADGSDGTKIGRWKIDADACVTAGITVQAGRGDRTPPPPIHLIQPNGGERFRPGTVATIGWDGVAPETPVKLDYSIDKGATWKTVADRTSGGIYRWTVPPTPSENCLARVTALGEKASGIDTLQTLITIPSEDGVYAVLPGGKEILTLTGRGSTSGREGTVDEATFVRWDLATGRQLATFKTSGVEVHLQRNSANHIDVDPAGRYALIEGSTNEETSSFLVDLRTGKQLWWFRGRSRNDPAYMTSTERLSPFSPDGSLVLLSLYSDKGEAIAVVDAATKRVRATVGELNQYVYTAQFLPDGRTVLTAGKDGVTLWNAVNGTRVRRLTSEEYTNAVVSPDGSLVAAVGKDNKLHVWESATGKEVGAFPIGSRGEGYRRPRFSPDGSKLVVWKNDFATLIDARTGAEVGMLGDKNDRTTQSGNDVLFSRDGSTAVVAANNTVHVWNVAAQQQFAVDANKIFKTLVTLVESPEGQSLIWYDQNARGDRNSLNVVPIIGSSQGGASSDASDNLWAIIDSRPAAIDVDFGARQVGSTNDSVVTGMIRNLGTDTLLLSSVSIAGADASEFAVVSGGSGVVPPGRSAPVEIRFAPSTTGARSAELKIEAGGATLTQRLSGTGVAQSLKVGGGQIDFGDVLVGTSREMEATAVIRNEGREPITVNGPTVVGPDTSHFTLLSSTGSFTLPPGESRTVSLRFAPDTVARYSTRLLFRTSDPHISAHVDVHGQGVTPGGRGDRWNDPTTFRTIAVPNAVIPKRGSIVAGSYDVLGLMVGYSPLDNVMILAGGAPPLPDDWGGVNGSMFGAYSIGLKVGFSITDNLRIGGGYQWGRSVNDKEETEEVDSRITVNVPYVAVSYGDDDHRITALGGYVYKRHRTWLDAPFLRIEEYNADAALASIGGDWRISDTWKLTGEAVYMGTIGVAPVMLGARLFGRSWALDFAAVLLVIPTGEGDLPPIPVAPLVSYVRRF